MFTRVHLWLSALLPLPLPSNFPAHSSRARIPNPKCYTRLLPASTRLSTRMKRDISGLLRLRPSSPGSLAATSQKTCGALSCVYALGKKRCNILLLLLLLLLSPSSLPPLSLLLLSLSLSLPLSLPLSILLSSFSTIFPSLPPSLFLTPTLTHFLYLSPHRRTSSRSSQPTRALYPGALTQTETRFCTRQHATGRRRSQRSCSGMRTSTIHTPRIPAARPPSTSRGRGRLQAVCFPDQTCV